MEGTPRACPSTTEKSAAASTQRELDARSARTQQVPDIATAFLTKRPRAISLVVTRTDSNIVNNVAKKLETKRADYDHLQLEVRKPRSTGRSFASSHGPTSPRGSASRPKPVAERARRPPSAIEEKAIDQVRSRAERLVPIRVQLEDGERGNSAHAAAVRVPLGHTATKAGTDSRWSTTSKLGPGPDQHQTATTARNGQRTVAADLVGSAALGTPPR